MTIDELMAAGGDELSKWAKPPPAGILGGGSDLCTLPLIKGFIEHLTIQLKIKLNRQNVC